MVARRASAVLLALLLGAGVAACGGDDGGSDDAVDQVDREHDGSDNGSDDGGSDDDDDANNDDDGGFGDDDGSSDDDVDIPDGIFGSEECEELFEAFAAFGGVFSDQGSADFGDLADGFDALAESAPEIADDLEVMGNAYRGFSEAVGDADFSDPSTFLDPEVAEASEAFSSDEFTEASDNVSDFMNEACALPGG